MLGITVFLIFLRYPVCSAVFLDKMKTLVSIRYFECMVNKTRHKEIKLLKIFCFNRRADAQDEYSPLVAFIDIKPFQS